MEMEMENRVTCLPCTQLHSTDANYIKGDIFKIFKKSKILKIFKIFKIFKKCSIFHTAETPPPPSRAITAGTAVPPRVRRASTGRLPRTRCTFADDDIYECFYECNQYATVLGRVNNCFSRRSPSLSVSIMDCKKRPRYTYELKNEIIQKVKDGIKRSDIQKEYGIHSGTLSRWLCSADKIIVKLMMNQFHAIQSNLRQMKVNV